MATHASRGPVDPEDRYPDNKRQRVIVYIILSVVFLSLMAVALGTFRSAKSSTAASAKADQLTTELTNAGYTPPPKDQITRVLGDDGGALCESPSSALKVGMERIATSNGAGGPGLRPVFVAGRLVQGELIAIKIYCPEQAQEFQNYVDSYRFAETIKN